MLEHRHLCRRRHYVGDVIAQQIDGSTNRCRSIASHYETGSRQLDPLQ
jgi:hypothetical protein